MDSFDAPMLRWPVQLEIMENEQWEDEKQKKREIIDQMAERERSDSWLIGCIAAALLAWIISAFLIYGLWLLADPLARLIARML